MNLFAYDLSDPINGTDRLGLLADEKFQVCCRPVGGVPGASRRLPGRPNPGLHCYVRMFRGDGSSTARTWSLLNIYGQAITGINHLVDLQWQEPKWCGSPTKCAGSDTKECLDRFTRSYGTKDYPTAGLGGPNSNTFARRASAACGVAGVPPEANSVDAPGWNRGQTP